MKWFQYGGPMKIWTDNVTYKFLLGGVEEEAVANKSKRDLPLKVLIIFDSN